MTQFDPTRRYTFRDGKIVEDEPWASPSQTEEEREEEWRRVQEYFQKRQRTFDADENTLLRHFGPGNVPRGLNGSNFRGRGWG